MACGTPIIVSDASSLPEVAGDVGLTVPPQDVGAWVSALRRAYEDDAWRAAARESGIARAAHFTWTDTAAQTVASYLRSQDN